ncbi:MAG: hypothetical protein AAGF25_04850 [Pseudomonadota bacterium]
MSLMQLTLRFIELEKELHEAIRVNDGDRIRDIDMQIELCFAQVLECEPANAQERQEKCAFLMERLCPIDSRHGIQKLICNKILELVSNDEGTGYPKARAK